MADPDGAPVGLRPEEEAALLRPRPGLDLAGPAYDGRSLPNVAASIVRATGVSLGDGPPTAPPLAPSIDPLGDDPGDGPLLLLLVDGLGWFPFSAWSRRSRSSAAPAWAAGAHPITTVYPTTTVAALVSLSTGTTPAQHGVVAPNLYLPRLGGVIDVLRMARIESAGREELVGPDGTLSGISGAPPLFRRGLSGTAVSREAFRGTGFSRLLYEGAEFVGYATASDFAHTLAEVLGRPAPPPVVFAYWDELDTVQHLRGVDPRLVDFELDRLVGLLGHVARTLGPSRARSVRALVSADHGFVPVDPARQLRIDRLPEIAEAMARPLAGDRRSGFLGARPGRLHDLEAACRRRLPPGSRLLRVDDALAAGLFGPPPYHPELRERIGDLIVLPAVPYGLLGPSPRPGSRSPEFRGSHSGLDAAELLVPLVAGPLSELGGADRTGGQP